MKNFEEFIDELKRIEPKSIGETFDISEDMIKKIPKLNEKIDEMIKWRGIIIHLSIELEATFNEIILCSTNPERVKVKGFKKKAGYVIQVLKEIDKGEKFINKKEFNKNIKRVIRIRHLYGHVPQNYFSEELNFESEGIYSDWKKDINK